MDKTKKRRYRAWKTTDFWKSKKTHGSTWCALPSYQKPVYDLLNHDLLGKKNATSTRQSPGLRSGQLPSSSPVEWEHRHQSSLATLIDKITSSPLLAYPDYNALFVVHTDASQDGLRAVLSEAELLYPGDCVWI